MGFLILINFQKCASKSEYGIQPLFETQLERRTKVESESHSLEMAGGLPSNFLRIKKKNIRMFTEDFLPRAWQMGFDYTPFFFPVMLFLLSPVGATTALNQSSRSRTGHIWAIKYPDWS